MKFLGVFVLLFSLSVSAKDKSGGFTEVHSSDESDVESSSDAETSSSESEPKVVLKEDEEILSGTVRIIRKIDNTEVFFKDIKDSYIIPSGSGYSTIFKAMEQSQKKGSAVSFKANTKSRRVLSMESSKAKSATASKAAESNLKEGSK